MSDTTNDMRTEPNWEAECQQLREKVSAMRERVQSLEGLVRELSAESGRYKEHEGWASRLSAKP